MLKMILQRAAVTTMLAFALMSRADAQTLRIAGALSNFDCWNNCNTDAGGFEIEIEGLHHQDVVHTWNYSAFGAPTVVDGGTATLPTVIIRYHSNTASLAVGLVTHFGVSLNTYAPATAIHYRWLPKATTAIPNPPPVPALLPPHTAEVVFTNGVASVRDVIHNTEPVGGKSIWVMPFAHAVPRIVTLEELMSDNPVTQGGTPRGGGRNGTKLTILAPGESWISEDESGRDDSSSVYTFQIYEDIVGPGHGSQAHTAGRLITNMMDATITTTGPVVPNQLTLSNVFVYGSEVVTATVGINGSSPAGGLTVLLSSSDPHVTLPASVVVSANTYSVTFNVGTTPVSNTTIATIGAKVSNSTTSVSGTLEVRPPALSTLYLSFRENFSGVSFDGSVFLFTPAPVGGTTVNLVSSDPNAASVPVSVTVPAGQTTAPFTVKTGLIAARQVITIGATLGTITLSQSLTVNPSPRTIAGTVTLEACTKPAQPVIFVLRAKDGTGDITKTLTLGADGSFTLPGVPAKNYDLAIKGDRWLRKVILSDVSLSNVVGLSVTLKTGDVNNDNAVDFGDLSTMLQSYNAIQGDGVYEQNPTADLNMDGGIDFGDLSALLQNYNELGDD